MSSNIKPVVRIAPSPTGNLHVGTARSALFNFLFARQNDGKFIVRIEDTDKERSTKEFEKNILEGFEWLGLNYDELYRQSERTDIYKSELEKLLEKGSIYLSKEEVASGGKRSEVIRFKNPNKIVTFHDEVRGEVSFDTTELGDFVIAKSMEEPLYHFAVVVDDFLSKITHVIRGEDHISNTPRQILIQEAIGAPRPIYAHLPLILGKDRTKLSKRHGAASINDFREKGYLPEAMVNFLALLGFNPGTDREIYSLDELVNVFDLKKIQKGGAIFDEEKLQWMNKEHLKLLPEQTIDRLLSERGVKEISVDFQEKVDILGRLYFSLDFEFLNRPISYNPDMLVWKKSDKNSTEKHLKHVLDILHELHNWTASSIRDALWSYAEKEGRGDVLWPLRFSLTGQERSPDPFISAALLGRDETVKRIKYAINSLK